MAIDVELPEQNEESAEAFITETRKRALAFLVCAAKTPGAILKVSLSDEDDVPTSLALAVVGNSEAVAEILKAVERLEE